ncbi:MAG: hypothetical protein R2769_16485 [Saprospiraceae bacterium]
MCDSIEPEFNRSAFERNNRKKRDLYRSTFNFNGTILSNAGTYLDTLLDRNGCDSFITPQSGNQ